MKNETDHPENTKERIIATAEKLFAEKGYAGVSIRDITQSARCNVAAVNYHFGNKENLYFDVFRKRLIPKMAKLRSRMENHIAQYDNVTLEIVVRALVTGVFQNNRLGKKDDVFHRLVNSERPSPEKAKEIIVNEALVPFYEALMDLFNPHLPTGMDVLKIKLHILSILSMALYFSHSQFSVSGFTRREYDEAFINTLIDHTVAFALQGLNGITTGGS